MINHSLHLRFAIDEIIEVYASAPKSKEIKVDEVIFGYNGIDDNTAITARKGDRIPIHIKLTGTFVRASWLSDG